MTRVRKKGELPPPSDSGGDRPAKKPKLATRHVSSTLPPGAHPIENNLAGVVRFLANEVRSNKRRPLVNRTTHGPVKKETS